MNDTKESLCVNRVIKMSNGNLNLNDKFESGLIFSFSKRKLSDLAEIKVSTIPNTKTSLISKFQISVYGSKIDILNYAINDSSTFDEEMYFTWAEGIGFIYFSNIDSNKAYKYISCNSENNEIIESILSKIKKQ